MIKMEQTLNIRKEIEGKKNCPICKRKVAWIDKWDGEVVVLDKKVYHKDCLWRLVLKNSVAQDREAVTKEKK